jgi:hypothetical protein
MAIRKVPAAVVTICRPAVAWTNELNLLCPSQSGPMVAAIGPDFFSLTYARHHLHLLHGVDNTFDADFRSRLDLW